VLLNRDTADGIANGSITLVLRRRDAPRALKMGGAGGTQRTMGGTIRLIAANDAVRAPDLAERVGMDVPRFKRRIRQLKGLGLTISLDVGYRLSPRSRAFLRQSR
jgi:hypothetical protein